MSPAALQWKRYLSYLPEDSYGSQTAAPGAVMRHIDIAGEGLQHRPARSAITPEGLGSDERVFDGRAQAEGSTDVLPDWSALLDWMTHLAGPGTVSSVGLDGEGDQYEWVHDPAHRPRSMLLQLYPDVRVLAYPGAFARTARWGTSQPQHFAMSLGWLAQRQLDGGAIPARDEAVFPVPLAVGAAGGPTFTGTLLIAGDAVDGGGQFGAQMAWDRQLRLAEGEPYPVGLRGGGSVDAQGSLRWRFNEDTLPRLEAFRTLTECAITGRWDGPLLAGPGSARYAFELHLPRAWVSRSSGPNVRGAGGPGSIELTTEWSALADPATSNSPYRCRLVLPAAGP